MKSPSSFLSNTTAPTGRTQGQATNDPGGSQGSGVDQEIYNDPAYAIIAMAETWKEGGVSGLDETTINSDMRDAVEELTSKKVVGIPEFVASTTYSDPGTLTDVVMWKGFQFVNVSNINNLGNDPLLNPKVWHMIPDIKDIMKMHFSGLPQNGELLPVADRLSGQYLQNFFTGKYRLGGNGESFYDFNRIHLDGSVVTGNTELEEILDVGGSNEYFNLDLIAPDVLGTRTLLDVGDYVLTPQSDGGDADIMGVLVEDQGQYHWHTIGTTNEPEKYGNQGTPDSQSGDNCLYKGNTDVYRTIAGTILEDTINGGGTPRLGSTTHGKRLTVGTSYIIVMTPSA